MKLSECDRANREGENMQLEAYSPVSGWAVACLCLGILCGLSFVFPQFAILALAALTCGTVAGLRTRKYEQSGRWLVRAGLFAAMITAIGGPLWNLSLYRAESLPGYARLDFAALAKPSDVEHWQPHVGRRVCLKGYPLAPGQPAPTKSFLLSPDGDRSQSRNAVLVELPVNDTWNWSAFELSISGELVTNPESAGNPELPRYILKNAVVRRSRTPYGIAARDSNC